MKKGVQLFIAVLFLLTVKGQALCITPADSAYLAEVSGTGKVNSLFSIRLSLDVLSKCAPGCPDLRLYSADNKEIPYVLIESRPQQSAKTNYELTALEYNEDKKGSSTVILKAPAKATEITALDISSSNRDFKKAVTLLGSNDKVSWKQVATGAFYDFSSKLDLRNTRLEWTTPSSYTYYKLSLTDASKGADQESSITLKYKELSFSTETSVTNALRIDRVSVFSKPSFTSPSLDSLTMNDFTRTTDENGNTVILLEPGVPVETITLNTLKPAYYYRTVKVYAADSAGQDAYVFHGSAAVYNFPLFEGRRTQNSIPLNGLWRSHIKIVIENGDNPPLEINSLAVHWLERSIYFFSDSPVFTYKLGIGGTGLQKPSYETDKMITRDNIASLNPAALYPKSMQKNAAYSASSSKPVSRESHEKTVLTVIVAILAIIITGWTYKIIKHSNLQK